MPASRLRRLTTTALVTGAAALGLSSTAAAADASCTRYASPAGADAAAGSAAAPFRTAQRLIDSLGPGETGCLADGTYTDGGRSYVARFGRAGTAAAPITLRSAPGQHATLKGVVFVVHGADHVTLSGLTLDGRPSSGTPTPSPQVMAADTTFEANEITNGATDICMIVGNTGEWGRAARTVVTGNRFHDCGSDRQLDHSIYVEAVEDARITGNTFVRTSAYAVHIYPDAHGTLVAGNVMDDNGGGVIFAGEGGQASTDNVVERNVITGSHHKPGISSWWGGTVGRGNVARDNCLSDNASGGVVTSGGGFTASGNLSAAPGYVDRAAGDYRLRPDSPCLSKVAVATAASAQGAATPAPAASTPASPASPGAAPAAPTAAKAHAKAKAKKKTAGQKARAKARKARAARKRACTRIARAARRGGASPKKVRQAALRCVARATRRA